MTTSKNNPKKMVDNTSTTTMVKEAKGKVKTELLKEEKEVKKTKVKNKVKSKAKPKKTAKKPSKKKPKSNKEKVEKEEKAFAKALGIKKVTKLKRWLSEHGLSQLKLSQETGCSTNTMNRLVKYGHEGAISKSTKISVARYLGITLDKIEKLMDFEQPL